MKCKLTTQDMKTRVGYYNETTWAVGEWQGVICNSIKDLCSPAFIHWYSHPLVAAVMSPIHGMFHNPRCWEIETSGEELDDHGLKGGSKFVRLVREIPFPKITEKQLVAIDRVIFRAMSKAEWVRRHCNDLFWPPAAYFESGTRCGVAEKLQWVVCTYAEILITINPLEIIQQGIEEAGDEDRTTAESKR